MIKKRLKKKVFVFVLTFPEVAYQPLSGMAVFATFVADIGSWLRMVGRVRRFLGMFIVTTIRHSNYVCTCMFSDGKNLVTK